MPERVFDIIEFTGESQRYYGDSIAMPSILLETNDYVKRSEKQIRLGQSRYGGPVMDLPPGVSCPPGLRFAAQLELTAFAPFDKTGLLPQTGQLIFFADIGSDAGQVAYANVPNEQLTRVIDEHEDNFFEGVLVEQVFAATETLAGRYREVEFEDEREYANADGKIWDDAAGGEKSKLFGIFTHCQWGETEVMEVVDSDRVLLLQVGEGNFNDEGVFSVLIKRTDLQNRHFADCEFYWAQT